MLRFFEFFLGEKSIFEQEHMLKILNTFEIHFKIVILANIQRTAACRIPSKSSDRFYWPKLPCRKNPDEDDANAIDKENTLVNLIFIYRHFFFQLGAN